MNYAKYLSSCVLALVLSSGCETQYPYCEETVTVLDSLDTPTPAGVSAREVFELIEGERSTELEYAQPGDSGVHVEIGPGGEGSTPLTLALSRAASGGLRWIDAKEVYPKGPGPVAEIGVHCPDRLEIDAQLEFESEDGLFAELFEVVVGVELDDFRDELGVARIRQEFEPEGLMGALKVLAIDPPNPDSIDYALEIHYPLAEWTLTDGGAVGQPRGMIGGGAQYTSGKGKDATVNYGSFQIATFGAWNY